MLGPPPKDLDDRDDPNWSLEVIAARWSGDGGERTGQWTPVQRGERERKRAVGATEQGAHMSSMKISGTDLNGAPFYSGPGVGSK